MICGRVELCMQEVLSRAAVSKCDNNNDKCIESSDRRSEVKCEENRKKYVLENTLGNQVISYRMDGGMIAEDSSVPEGVNKCDYMLVVGSRELSAVLIELKGIKVSKALEQIQGSLVLYKNVFRKFAHVYGRVIVTSSVPDLKASPKYVNLAKLIRGTYQGNLKIIERVFREKDTELSKEQKK